MIKSKGWTSISNKILNSKEISLNAKGLFLYLKSKPQYYNFAVHRIQAETKDGNKKIRSCIKELKEYGLLEIKARFNHIGQARGANYIVSKQKASKNWTPISNDILTDPSLSFKAKALFAYLKSKPKEWDFAVYRMKSQLKEKDSGIRSGLKELKNEGYLDYYIRHNKVGKASGQNYILCESKNANLKGLSTFKGIRKSCIQQRGIQSKTDISKTDISKTIHSNKKEKIIKKKKDFADTRRIARIRDTEIRMNAFLNDPLFIEVKNRYFDGKLTESLLLSVRIFLGSYPDCKLSTLIKYVIEFNTKLNILTEKDLRLKNTIRIQSNKQLKPKYKSTKKPFEYKTKHWHPSYDKTVKDVGKVSEAEIKQSYKSRLDVYKQNGVEVPIDVKIQAYKVEGKDTSQLEKTLDKPSNKNIDIVKQNIDYSELKPLLTKLNTIQGMVLVNKNLSLEFLQKTKLKDGNGQRSISYFIPSLEDVNKDNIDYKIKEVIEGIKGYMDRKQPDNPKPKPEKSVKGNLNLKSSLFKYYTQKIPKFDNWLQSNKLELNKVLHDYE